MVFRVFCCYKFREPHSSSVVSLGSGFGIILTRFPASVFTKIKINCTYSGSIRSISGNNRFYLPVKSIVTVCCYSSFPVRYALDVTAKVISIVYGCVIGICKSLKVSIGIIAVRYYSSLGICNRSYSIQFIISSCDGSVSVSHCKDI